MRFLQKKPCGKTHDSSYWYISDSWLPKTSFWRVPWKNWSLDGLPTTTSNSSWPKINSKEGCPKKTHDFIDILEDDPALPTQYGMWWFLPTICSYVTSYTHLQLRSEVVKFTELKDLFFQLRGGTNILRHESLLPAFSRSFFSANHRFFHVRCFCTRLALHYVLALCCSSELPRQILRSSIVGEIACFFWLEIGTQPKINAPTFPGKQVAKIISINFTF